MSEPNKKESSKPKYNDIFIANSIYPEVDSIFKVNQSLEEIKVDCYIVLDTNVLLIPYNTGKESLSQIKKTYQKLLTESRLIVPAQVAREFVKNRPDKLIDLHQKLTNKRNKKFKEGTYPLLESVSEYQEILKIENEIEGQLKEYKEKIDKLLKHVENWTWNDPISLIYAELFNKNVIFSIDINEEEIKKDLERRKEYTIPPGYKDASKQDDGVGDLLIWNTILEVGKKYKKSVIFVSGEKKPDWWHKSAGSALYPRYELVDEFRRFSGGQSFHLIELSHLLELYGANETVINEIKQEEKEINYRNITLTNYNFYAKDSRFKKLQIGKISIKLETFINKNITIAKENIELCDRYIAEPEVEIVSNIIPFYTQIADSWLAILNSNNREETIRNFQRVIDHLERANGLMRELLSIIEGDVSATNSIEETLITLIKEIREYAMLFNYRASEWKAENFNL